MFNLLEKKGFNKIKENLGKFKIHNAGNILKKKITITIFIKNDSNFQLFELFFFESELGVEMYENKILLIYLVSKSSYTFTVIVVS